MSIKTVSLGNLTRALNKLKDYFVQIKDAILTVNNTEPDENGNVQIDRVDLAGDIESSFTQNSTEEYVQRTSGGEASINDGDAWLVSLQANSSHIGFVQEVIDMEVLPISAETPIDATIDESIFRQAVSSSGTITLTFTTAWSADPGTYGITVTGTPSAGDQIKVEYTKGELGTIYNATPATFVSTGWNLYNHTSGYAKVVKYSDEYGYRIVGAGSDKTLKFSTTISGTKTELTVTDGLFNVPSDGFVWPTDPDGSTTAIYPTWSDWTEEPNNGTWEGYTATEIDLSTVMQTHFPYGLLQVETARDELNISLGQAISRVERMANTAENMTAAEQSGRAYDYDENYIYLVRATATIGTFTLDGSYTASDHGIEYFTQTDTPVLARTIYGTNLKNKLERDVLTISQQTLTEEQQAQVQENLGISGIDEDLVIDLVKGYNSVYLGGSTSDALTALTNLAVTESSGRVITFTGLSGLGSALVGKSGTCFGIGKVRTTNFDFFAFSGGSYICMGRLYRVAEEGHAVGDVLRNWKNYT